MVSIEKSKLSVSPGLINEKPNRKFPIKTVLQPKNVLLGHATLSLKN